LKCKSIISDNRKLLPEQKVSVSLVDVVSGIWHPESCIGKGPTVLTDFKTGRLRWIYIKNTVFVSYEKFGFQPL